MNERIWNELQKEQRDVVEVRDKQFFFEDSMSFDNR